MIQLGGWTSPRRQLSRKCAVSKARVTVHGQIKFLELAARALGDTQLGFHLARECELRELGLLYYVLTSSETLSDAMDKAGTHDKTAFAALPKTTGTPVFLTDAQTQKAKDYLAANWAKAIA